MTSYLLLIIGIIVVIFLVFKFVRSIIKGIIILAVLALAVLAYNHFSATTGSFKSTVSVPTVVEQKIPEQELKKVLKKIKDLNTEDAEKYLQKSQAELAKYGLTVDAVKNALKELKP